MLGVGSENAGVGFADGLRVLRAGGRALDAVESAIRRVESNPADHSVGHGGLPNILGEVELDASIMDGRSLEAGAVCAVQGYEHVISLARQVMRRLPHVFLAGDGAEHLARELHMPRRRLLTTRARATFDRKVTPRLHRRYRKLHVQTRVGVPCPARPAYDHPMTTPDANAASDPLSRALDHLAAGAWQ